MDDQGVDIQGGDSGDLSGRVSDLDVISSLSDPLRRALYEFVASASESVSRDEAAEAQGVSRQVAAYHLDRLADDGLLDFEFRRLSGRDGPGAGRPAKLYHRSGQAYDVSVPPRRYELAAQILLEAVSAGHVEADRLAEVARRAGCDIGAAGMQAALRETGYEPVEESGETRFRNCPFHTLRDQDLDLTCGMNLALVEGMIDGSGSPLSAVLAPEDGYCCVRLHPALPEGAS